MEKKRRSVHPKVLTSAGFSRSSSARFVLRKLSRTRAKADELMKRWMNAIPPLPRRGVKVCSACRKPCDTKRPAVSPERKSGVQIKGRHSVPFSFISVQHNCSLPLEI